jgi:NAD-dependent SIR2 family protein deacetylase
MTHSEENRRPDNLYQEAYASIAEHLRKGDVRFLIGAGMSRDGGIDLGGGLAKRMLRRAALGPREVDNAHPTLDKVATSYPFEAIAEYLGKKLGNEAFVKWLCEKKQGGFDNAKPKDPHKYLYELWASLGPKFLPMVFTTNFDALIEDEFGSDAMCVTSENMSALAEAKQGNKLAVVHLHGCVKFPKSIVFGEEKQTTLEGPVFDQFRASLATEVFVLIGYSLSDTNLRHVFFNVQRVAKTREGLTKRTFAAAPAGGSLEDPASEVTIAKEIWLQRGVDYLAVSAAEFFERVSADSGELAFMRMRDVVADALKKSPDTLNKMLESAAKPFEVIEPRDLLEYAYCAVAPGIAEETKEEKE